ncbi:MAG: zinc metalloprotease HtpX [Promethearchaeota archaeon]
MKKIGLRLASTIATTALFALLYAVVFLIGTWFLPFTLYGLLIMVFITIGIVFLQYLISPYIINWVYRIDWMTPDEFAWKYPQLRDTLDTVVRTNGIKMPKLGVIHDFNPNAFTFGWGKNSSRIVLTDGIFHYLDEDEQNAVLAHELGHVIHSDFILMTIVFAIPLVLLTIARWAYYASFFSRTRRVSSKDSESAAYLQIALIIIAALSYIAYYIGFLISLIVSRIREYYADEHSAEVLRNPNALSTGLIKIAYGLLVDANVEERRKSPVRALKGLGIFDPRAAKAVAISSVGRGGSFSKDIIEATAAWDLFNPWARFYELISTHPLPAKRIMRLNEQCPTYGLKPAIDFSRARQLKEQQAGKTLWDEFLTDLLIKYLPSVVFVLLVAVSIVWFFAILLQVNDTITNAFTGSNLLLMWAVGFYLIAFAFIIKTQFMYKSGFEPKHISDLLVNVKVSPIRCEPAILEGIIVGQGIPGYYFSDDLYFQDDTGLLYIDYRFGLSIVDFFWAILKARKLVGQRVRIKGWYRRGPSPYLQVDTIETAHGERYRNYSKHMTYIWAILAFLVGIVLLALWLFG